MMMLKSILKLFRSNSSQTADPNLHKPALESATPNLFPWPCGGTSQGVLFGNAHRGALVYECWPNKESDGRIEYAVLKIEDGIHFTVGSPNDEVQCNHPLHQFNTDYSPIVEVTDSPLISEMLYRSSRRDRPRVNRPVRHYLFFLKENTVEVIAERVNLLGIYTDKHDAHKIATGLI